MAYVERCGLYVQNTIINSIPFWPMPAYTRGGQKSWDHNQSDKNSLAGNLTAPT